MKKQDYQRLVFWSEEDKEYVATIPGLPLISALAETQEKALAELDIALDLLLEDCEKDGDPYPQPTPLSALTKAASILNLSALAREIGVKQSTLATKIARGKELSPEEGAAVQKALSESGLALV